MVSHPAENSADSSTIIAEGHGRLRPRARLLRTIGAELISSELVAVIELVRNCYDADATRVELVFEKPHLPEEARLTIRDNGHGMSREILLGPWLEPATDHKAGTGVGPLAGSHSPGGRRRLGSKGVGRFAAQRLGSRLVVQTRAPESETELLAWFNWDELDRADRYLDQLAIPWREQEAEHLKSHGTALVMHRLRDHWTPERFDKLRLGLERLLGPGMHSSGFSIHLIIDGVREAIQPALDKVQAMYSLKGTVAVGGQCRLVYKDINGAEEVWERVVFWPEEGGNCGPFTFHISAWDLDREPLRLFLEKTGAGYGLRDFRRLIREHSGISLYRDGFRILPYGEPDNDWLRLDRRRVNNPTMRLSNNQILGVLQLTADSNPGLKDQTNREGLVTNEAYSHLQQVVLELMGYLENRRFSARRSMDIVWSRRSAILPELQTGPEKEIDTLLEGLSDGKNSAKQARRLKELLSERRGAVTDSVQHYASLATVGHLSGLVFEQLNHPMRQLKSQLRELKMELGGDLEPEDIEDLQFSVERMMRLVDGLERRMEKMDPLAMGRRERKPERVKLEQLARQVIDAFEDRLNAAEIIWEIKGKKDAELETVPTVIQQALANLVDNAIYWLGQRKRGRILRVLILKTELIVVNNGPLIPIELHERIFDPHFSTRPEAAGMGLALSRDLLASIGWRLKVRNVEDQVWFSLELV